MYTTSVVCLVSGMWGSMVCGVEVGGMWRELVCGDKCYVGEGRSTVCWVSLRSVVCEASGMLGQQYMEAMVWEVSEWCMRSAVCCVSGVGSMVCISNM